MAKAKEQTCWASGCKNIVPRSEWPQEHGWGLWCREHLDLASAPFRAPGGERGDSDEYVREMETLNPNDLKAALRQGQQR